MKYLIVTDIHGGKDAASFITNKFKDGFDRILILGDILYHGPRNDLPLDYAPKEVIKALNPLADKIIAVEGNCDAYVDQMVLNFKIAKEAFIEVNNRLIYLTHGHLINYESPIKLAEGSIVLHGHTHIIREDLVDGVYYLNLGSITLPKNNTKKCYGVLDENGIFFYDLEDNLLLGHPFK